MIYIETLVKVDSQSRLNLPKPLLISIFA